MFLIQSIRLKNLPYSKLELIFSLEKINPKDSEPKVLLSFVLNSS